MSPNYHFVRIVHHIFHICMVFPQCGCGHVPSNYYFVRIVHHMFHIYDFSPVWIRICFFKLLFCENSAPQVSHLYGFSPVWIRICVHKLALCANCAPQVSQLYGFSPVWIQTWAFNVHLSENCGPHISHLYGFSPVWVRIWLFKLCFHKKIIPQMSHLNCFAMVRVFTLTAILKILLLLTRFHWPNRGCSLVSSGLYCLNGSSKMSLRLRRIQPNSEKNVMHSCHDIITLCLIIQRHV